MGYYTDYELSVYSGEHVDKGILNEDVSRISKYVFHYLVAQDVTWYRHSGNMKALSKQYPNTVFLLEGEGEEAGDIWKKYYKNGEEQVCKAIITFEECKF